MALPFIGLIAAGLIALACNREEDAPPTSAKNAKIPPKPEGPEKKTFLCSSPPEKLELGEKTLAFCHEDKNQDGIIQLEQEPFRIQDGESVYQASENEPFQKFLRQYGLPNFQGLNLSQWAKVRREAANLKFQTIGVEDEARFSEVIGFFKEKNIHLEEAHRLAGQIKPLGPYKFLNFKEMTYALLISGLWLKFKGDPNSTFYQNNKSMIDEVYQNILDGKLHLQTSQKGKRQMFSAIYYDEEKNLIDFNSDPPGLTSVSGLSVILHELVHFHQDIRKARLTLLETEKEAHFKQADFIIHWEGLDQGSGSPERIEEYFNLNQSPLFKDPNGTVASIKARYFEIHGNKRKAEVYRKKFDQESFLQRGMVMLDAYRRMADAMPEAKLAIQRYRDMDAEGGQTREKALNELKEDLRAGIVRRDEVWRKLKHADKRYEKGLKDALHEFFYVWAMTLISETLIYQISNPTKAKKGTEDEGLRAASLKWLEDFKKQYLELPPSIFLPLTKDGM